VIGELKPYPAYKDSGLPWLRQVPTHWNVVRNGSLFGQRSQTGYADLPILEVSLKTGVQVRSFGAAKRKQVMSDLSKYKRAVKGDLAYNTMRMWQGALGVCPADGLVSPAYVVARPYPGVQTQYFASLFRTGDYMAQIDAASRGIVKDRNRLYWDQFKQMQSPCPPPDEQVAIVRILEWANGRLERAIRAKRKVVALLTEQRQSITQRAVTLGVEPGVPLKPTGLEWLTAVPAHWEVRPLKAVSEIQSGITLGKDYGGQRTEVFPYLRVANVQAGFVDLSEVKLIQVPTEEARRSMLAMGDVLMTEGGDADKLGRGCVWDALISPCLHQNHVFAVRPKQHRLNPKFLSAFMGTSYARAYFQATAKQTTNLASTNKTKIGRLQVPLPPIEEQGNILDRVALDTRPITSAIGRLEAEIQLLREYRVRLVADVVTGQLDAREAALRLPADAPQDLEADPVDDTDALELIDEEATEA
jgi:type I restriction enzyme, S subunit